MLQEYEGTLSFAMDAWTLPNHKAFVAVTVHFERDGKPMCLILDVVEVVMSHSGANLAAAFAQILEQFGISDKVSLHMTIVDMLLTCGSQLLCITCDNTSPKDTMIESLSGLLKSFLGDANRARCFNHVIALVAKSSIHQFDVPKGRADAVLDEAERELRELAEGLDIEEEQTKGKWEGPDNEEDEEGEDPVGWVDEVAGLSVADHEELEENIRPVKLVLVKVSVNLL